MIRHTYIAATVLLSIASISEHAEPQFDLRSRHVEPNLPH